MKKGPSDTAEKERERNTRGEERRGEAYDGIRAVERSVSRTSYTTIAYCRCCEGKGREAGVGAMIRR